MKLFLDSANIEEIREVAGWGVLDGVTTNPSLCSKESAGFEENIRAICALTPGPVSAECVSLQADAIVPEARALAKLAPNIAVKIPVGVEGLKAAKRLAAEGIAVNMTLIFSAGQALLAAKAGARFVSPFIGRLDDVSEDGMALIDEIVQIFDNYDIKTEVIVASVRHPRHVIEAARLGADIATVPFGVMEKLVRHPLTDIGVERFLADWRKVKK
ncbi:MAG TPA: fructose-6-phosphate aldolase [Candidatus Aminicenantes bacterium]|nr:fructose-6-phosphate aldolase [Candidatus Aminicenantes bacterium]HRY65014.1 fructose-6-phosphate aldolase [Candidatus Aminicenantes bacterium]HRZ71927.1 fructose-6-phosphate aldolase [Candidatus Aminicenantes bacterium]